LNSGGTGQIVVLQKLHICFGPVTAHQLSIAAATYSSSVPSILHTCCSSLLHHLLFFAVLQALANLVKQQEIMLQQLQQLSMAPLGHQQHPTPDAAAAGTTADHAATCNDSGNISSHSNQQSRGVGVCRNSSTYRSPFMLRHEELEQLLDKSSAGGSNHTNSSTDEAVVVTGVHASSSGAAVGLASDAATGAQTVQQRQPVQQQGYAFQLLQQATAEQWERVARMTALVSRLSVQQHLHCWPSAHVLVSQLLQVFRNIHPSAARIPRLHSVLVVCAVCCSSYCCMQPSTLSCWLPSTGCGLFACAGLV
jgi:hypothetical protein